MHCSSCHHYLGSHRTGFVPCERCLYLNIAPSASFQDKPIAIPRQIGGKRLQSLKRIHLIIGASLAVGLLLFSVMVHSFAVGNQVAGAARLDASGHYAAAQQKLQTISTAFVWPGVASGAGAETKQNKVWLADQGYQISAETLLKSNQAPAAIIQLQKIKHDYPSYKAVAQDIARAQSAITIAVLTPPTTPTPTPTPVVAPTPAIAAKPKSAPIKVATPVAPAPSPIVTNSLCKVDATLAPDMLAVAKNIAAVCLLNYPKIEQLLAVSSLPAPHPITLTNTTYAIAYTQGADVTLQIAYLRTQPTDMGMVVHELTHVVQGYPGGPGWITEGIADYVRFQLGYATSWTYFHCASDVRYTDGYNCGATFLRYVQLHYDSNIIKQVDASMRANTYTDALFQAKTGKTIAQLYTACLQTDCKGGKP
jgi:hypothetical protein